MHAVVCIKQVPDTTEVRMDPKTNTLIREGVPSIINPYDVHALEEALRLKEKFGGKVTVLTMGPPQAKAALKKAISFGADDAILISDRVFAGSDTLATSYILSQGIRKIMAEEKVDIVLCGKLAIDGDTGQVGPGIARRLGFAQLTNVVKIDYLDFQTDEIRVQRKLEGARDVIVSRLPALLTVEKEINEVRYASFDNILRSVSFEPRLWNSQDIEVDTSQIGVKGSPTTVRKIFPPPKRETTVEIIPGGKENPEMAVAMLVEKLVGTLTVQN